MSLQSWKEEFYNIPADDATTSNALDLSILKWEGLKPENITRHFLTVGVYGKIVDSYNNTLWIDGNSCSLCAVYMEDNDTCCCCPLYEARDFTPCDSPKENEDTAPYQEWSKNNNPEPMILWLNKTKEVNNAIQS